MSKPAKRGSRKAPPGIKKPDAKRQKHLVPTVEEIQEDNLTPVANAYWAQGKKDLKPYNAAIVDDIYKNELANRPIINDRVTMLELSSYLENYLWKNFDDEKATFSHVMSIIMLVNEKFRQNLLDVWTPFHEREEMFVPFLKRVWTLKADHTLTTHESNAYIVFLIKVFQSLEDPVVRSCCLRLTSPVLWQTLSPGMLKKQVKLFPGYKRYLRKIQKSKGSLEVEKNFLPDLIADFMNTLASITPQSDFTCEKTKLTIGYCERFLEFMIDLMAQLPTRRFFHAVLMDTQFPVLCQLSTLNNMREGAKAPGLLFSHLLRMLKYYLHFEIDDQTGNSLTENEMLSRHYSKIQELQLTVFKHFRKELSELASLNVGAIDKREPLREHLAPLPVSSLRLLGEKLGILEPLKEGAVDSMTKEVLMEIIVYAHELRKSQKQQTKALPLYPTEEILWDENVVPSQNYQGEGALALPKLNLQFLTFHDYLQRNFDLYRLESTYEIREDIANTVFKLRPRLSGKRETVFTGHGRMACPIYTFSITQVKKPKIGETKPALVKADISVDLSPFSRSQARQEWEELREHDVLFLVTVRAKENMDDKHWNSGAEGFDWGKINRDTLGIVTVRGAELVRVLDEDKKVVGQYDENGVPHVARGNMRTYQVELDAAQYQADMAKVVNEECEDPYTTFNLLVRRKPKENNFRAVLATIRDLMDGEFYMPDWLHDVFLGYGNCHAAQYYNLPQQLDSLAFRDTFQDKAHVQDSLPGTVEFEGVSEESDRNTFFDMTFPKGVQPDHSAIQTLLPFAERPKEQPKKAAPKPKKSSKKKKKKKKGEEEAAEAAPVEAKYVVRPTSRPRVWGDKQVKRNNVRFTPMQIEAIKSGINPGLTMVVGPPGTGKTDTAVQIISEMYHNFPDQRILLVTHSNHALNDLFEKIMERDIDERYLLRLGRGQDFLQSDKDFSKFGRVNHMLNRRMELLEEVQQLATNMDIKDDVGSTCETAGHFFLYHVTARWEKFLGESKELKGAEGLGKLFPFTLHFESLEPGTSLFDESKDLAHNMEIAWSCWRYLDRKFSELAEAKPFELLRTGKDRGTYLLTKHAKVIAMTCTHAAINRPNFIKWGFQYDNLIMEEAAQVLEIETFIPLMLQKDDKEFGNRLQRVVLLGDHHQLPPVIKNRAFQKFCHMDQSLFTRFVRLGMPYIQLNAQGRMRPTLAKLWNWKYQNLRDLPNVQTPRLELANCGLKHEFQLVDVQDYNGQGESTPSSYYFQNLGEAEYVIQLYMYLRLQGVPSEKISIITTYNGQKNLIRDVAASRCDKDPLFGAPAKITTVDKFQGQQNDFILVSLVRTRSAGHIRDVRRLVVAMSRARLGLYVFCRKELFSNCHEMRQAFEVLNSRPTQLQLVSGEKTADGLAQERKLTDEVECTTVRDVKHMGELVTVLRKDVEAQWEEYNRRVAEYNKKQQLEYETRRKREQEAAQARKKAALEEQKELAAKKKAAEYAKQTEEFMEETAKIVDKKEQESAMEEVDE